MPDIRFVGVILTVAAEFKPGDPPPLGGGYADTFEWAEVQHAAGLRQRPCCDCGAWRYPVEMSDEVIVSHPVRSDGTPVEIRHAICLRCVAARDGRCSTVAERP